MRHSRGTRCNTGWGHFSWLMWTEHSKVWYSIDRWVSWVPVLNISRWYKKPAIFETPCPWFKLSDSTSLSFSPHTSNHSAERYSHTQTMTLHQLSLLLMRGTVFGIEKNRRSISRGKRNVLKRLHNYRDMIPRSDPCRDGQILKCPNNLSNTSSMNLNYTLVFFESLSDLTSEL